MASPQAALSPVASVSRASATRQGDAGAPVRSQDAAAATRKQLADAVAA
jgi:hypothetical protein